MEQIANSATHLLCLPVSIYLSANLISKATSYNQTIVAAIYGFALISLFAASSAYHCCILFARKR